MLGIALLGGCAKGAEIDSLSFGPPETTEGPAGSTTPIDPTTGGLSGGTEGTEGLGGTEGLEGGSTQAVADESTTGDVDPTASSTGMVDPATSSTGPAGPVCGDGLAEDGEDCDGADLAGLACPEVNAMFTGGTLVCDAGCAFDTSGCSTADNPIHVCQVVNAAINDNSTTSSTIVLAAGMLGGTITDVEVEVELDHTYIADLQIDANSSGTSVTVFSGCASEDNLHATFDDQGGGAFACASSDANLTVTPFSPLSAFNGAAVTSNWSLDVADQASLDTGSLQQWCVTISWM